MYTKNKKIIFERISRYSGKLKKYSFKLVPDVQTKYKLDAAFNDVFARYIDQGKEDYYLAIKEILQIM